MTTLKAHTCLAGALASLILIGVSNSYASIEPLSTQKDTAKELVDKLESRHYSKQKLDNGLSSQFFDNYIDTIDSQRVYLYASDVAEFEKYRFSLDDLMRDGDVKPGFEIFNRYQERVVERLSTTLEQLPTLVAKLDFTRQEEILLDNKDQSWSVDSSEADERWRKQIKNQVLGLRIAGKDNEGITETLTRRYKNQLHRVEQFNAQDAFQLYANALTELYDPHTNYLSPRSSENFDITMRLSLEGIGAVLQLEDEYTRVTRIIPAGPADKQGELKASDKVIAVAQGEEGELVDVVGWRLDEVVELIRGPKDTLVKLLVIPAGMSSADTTKTVAIVRNKVKLEEQSAQKEIIEVPTAEGTVKLGVIKIPKFYIDFEAMRKGEPDYKSTTRDVKELLDELVAEDVQGLVIDLRNNGGGSLQEANDLTGLFIEYGPTVQIRHSSSKVFRDGKRMRSPYYDGPLTVLINRLSASASEIFAGAIQDYQRGTIVGAQSFGKGTVQTLIPLTEGQLKLTESKFYRISGDSTQHRGVIPDVEFPSLYDKEEIGESALDHALSWDQINPVRHKQYNDFDSLMPALSELFVQRAQANPDLIFLEEQVEFIEEVSEATTLSLHEETRLALREQRKDRGLAIENKRRLAKGLPPLKDLEENQSEETAETDGETVAASEEEEDDNDFDSSEVLLGEAGKILVDTMILQNQRFVAEVLKPASATQSTN
ncbi:MAG: carboxyl-terminal processing protease [Halieaceae bacterium]|jgi:carboxyl-terminal processing protease